MDQARISEDGRWYWDGHGWVPIPGVVTSPGEPDHEVDDEAPGAPVQPVDSDRVDFGIVLVLTDDDARTPAQHRRARKATRARLILLLLLLLVMIVVLLRFNAPLGW